MSIQNFSIQGLSDNEVTKAREKYGKNQLNYKKENTIIDTLIRILKDPMLILLLVAASIYFVSGSTGDGIFLSFANVFQTSISLYQ